MYVHILIKIILDMSWLYFIIDMYVVIPNAFGYI